jgi:hypothetical protein
MGKFNVTLLCLESAPLLFTLDVFVWRAKAQERGGWRKFLEQLKKVCSVNNNNNNNNNKGKVR